MRKLMFGVVLAVLVALPGTVLPGSELRTASPAGSASSASAGKVIRSSLGRSIALETLTVGDGMLTTAGQVAEFGSQSDSAEPAFGLLPSYPNPFNPVTTITYRLACATRVELAVYDVSGRLVRTLTSHRSDDGDIHQVIWDGTSDGGERLPSGIYLLRLLTETSAETRKLVLLK